MNIFLLWLFTFVLFVLTNSRLVGILNAGIFVCMIFYTLFFLMGLVF